MRNLKSWLVGVVAASVLAVSVPAMADRVDGRETNQAERIASGVKSGELTRREARKLRRGQRRVKGMERRAERDGVVTAGEAKRIEKAQDRQSRKIFKQKRDRQDRRAR